MTATVAKPGRLAGRIALVTGASRGIGAAIARDVLVGNAGVLGTLSPLGHISPKEFQEVIDINLTANWRLLRSLDPLLRQSEAGRAIFLTSGAARGPRAYWGTYAISKAALEMMVGIYAQEIQQTKVRAN
ncbi:MAG: SDR family NAD(P)-dependent oxidoreductase, partial [Rhodospirillaceae bacterium]|nr:SDR family NAD(P)-dependent oxidoreductase [Rhodospirillaceae bacterium]